MRAEYTMITGATGGLGGAFVRLAAKSGENLILTGRYEGKLRLIKEKALAENAGIDVRIFACDLAEESERSAMMKKIAEEGWKIGRLVNVAGADIQKSFEEYTQEKFLFNAASISRRLRRCADLPSAIGQKSWKSSIFPACRGFVPCPISPFTAPAKSGFDLLFGGAERGDEGKGGKGDGGAAPARCPPRRREGTDCGTGRVGKARCKISRIRSRKKPARGGEK